MGMSHIIMEIKAHRFFMLNQFDRNSLFADVTLYLGDNTCISAHKLVLAASSNFLRNLLLEDDDDENVLILPDFPNTVVKMFLDFIYSGQADISSNNQGELLSILSVLPINTLPTVSCKQETVLPSDEEDWKGIHESEEITDNSKFSGHYENERKERSQKGDIQWKLDVIDRLFDADGNFKDLQNLRGNIKAKKKNKEENIANPTREPKSSIREKLICQICGYACHVSQSTTNKHIESVHGRNFTECHICGEKFAWETYLKRHIEIVHQEIKYDCDMCDYKSKKKIKLKFHKINVHEGKIFVCDICEKQFPDPYKLNIHVDNVHNERRLYCLKCDSKFESTRKAKAHRKEVHGLTKKLENRIPKWKWQEKLASWNKHL